MLEFALFLLGFLCGALSVLGLMLWRTLALAGKR